MNVNRSINTDLKKIIEDYPLQLNKFKNKNNLRNSPKELLWNERINNSSFNIENLYNCITTIEKNQNLKLKVLFAHFSPFENELEGLGLPLYFKKRFSNCMVDFTYDKSGPKSHSFRVEKENIFKIDKILSRYDIIIARSCVLKNMMNRNHDRNTLKNSAYIVNIKTMSYKPNYCYADYYFDEIEMSPPVDPIYKNNTDKYFLENKKTNLICVPGTVKDSKGQLSLIKNLNNDVLEKNKLVFFGGIEQKSHETEIRNICNLKNIEYYFLGHLGREISDTIKNMSKISLFNFQPTIVPSAYPRLVGECIASKSYVIGTNKIILPDYFNECASLYNYKDYDTMNMIIKEIVLKSKNPLFHKSFHQKICFNEFCEMTINKILKISNNNI